MKDLKWPAAERKIARRIFDAALERELASALAAFKEMAARAGQPEDMRRSRSG